MIGFLLAIPGKLKLYALAFGAAVLVLLGIYQKGRSDAAHKRDVKDLKVKVETMETAKEVRDEVDAKSDSAVRDALRDKWMR
jgi:predicted methyltransferase MtxX (methanogen marker protein 4)